MWARQSQKQRALQIQNWSAKKRDTQKSLQHKKSKKKNVLPEKQSRDLDKDEQEQEPDSDQEHARTKAELQRMRQNYASILKQLDAVRKDKYPLSSSEETAAWCKFRGDNNDKDDEEPNAPWLKLEPTSSVPRSGCVKRRQEFELSSGSFKASAKKARVHDEQRETSPSAMSIVTTSSASESSESASSAATPSAATLRTQSPDRSLTAEEEAADELRFLRARGSFFDGPKRKQRLTLASASKRLTAKEVQEQALDALKKNFHFAAIVSYDEDMDVDEYFDSSEDFNDCVEDLWDAILEINETWEASSGEYWKFEFESKLRDRPASFCISTVLKIPDRESGRCAWRPGGKGRFACKKCVQKVEPCFWWDGDAFKLLPLHEDDRIYDVEDGLEVRNWLNME